MSEQKSKTLAVQGLTYQYPTGTRIIFHDVNLDVKRGELVSILGPNGAGKSTLLNCMAGLFEPKAGNITIDGVNIADMSAKEAAMNIGYVPQSHQPVYDFTVREFVVMGRAPYIGAFGSPKAEDYDKVDAALERIGAGYLKDKIYTEISGGERQLAMIARAIVQEPDFIFLDEPTAHLDYGNQINAVRMIADLAESENYGVVMTTHNPDYVLYTGGKVAMLHKDGHLDFGNVDTLMHQDILTDLYKEPVHLFHSDVMGREVCLTGAVDPHKKSA